jgi:seryl-tRNA synthetase
MKYIREHIDEVRANLAARGSRVDLDQLMKLDERRRRLVNELDEVRRQRNELSESIKGRKPTDAERARGRELKEAEPALEASLAQAEAELDALNRTVPNITLPDVPAGVGEESNVEVRRWR